MGKVICLSENPVVIQLNNINEVIVWIVIVVLAIATLFQVLDMCGLLPPKFRKFLRLNRSQDTIEVLKELGININQYRKNNLTMGIPRDYPKENLEQKTKKDLEALKIDKFVSVGKIRQTELNY